MLTSSHVTFNPAGIAPVFDGNGKMSYIAPGAGNPARGESDSEKRYRALIRATADLVYRMNPDWTRMWQLDGKGFLGDAADAHHFWLDEYIPAEERERVHQAIAAAIRNKRVFELEHGVRLRDGTLGRVFSRAVPMLDADGEIYEWIGAASDVTVRQAAERKYRTLFNSIDEGFCIIDVPFDAHGRPYDYRFCEVNPSFETHSGLRDAAGKTIRELNPAHEQHWFSIYGDVQRTGQAVRFEHGSDSLERYFDVYAFRLEDGGQPKVAVLFKDISEAKRVTRQVRESEERAIAAARRAEQARRHLEALLQAAPVGIVMSDRNGGVVLTNAEHNRLWGGRPPQPGSVAEFAEWTGWWADESVRHGQRLEAEDWPTARALRGEFVRGATVQIASFGQPPVHHTLLLSGAPVYDEGNQVIGAVVVQMDITDRVKAEAALREADRKKDEFLAMLAHELRNPLAPISAAADLLAMARIDAGMIRRTSAIISRQVRHMAGLVDDLLDVSRVTRGLVNLKVEQLDLKQIVGEAMEQVRPLLESRRHNTILRTSPEPAAVSGDRTRLVQVLTNLLTNAAKYTPEGGHITVTTEVRDDAVQVHVVDNGIGIAPELIPHVFELFTQAQRTSDRSQGGLGIGLALVKRLIELQGGQVTAHSGGLGRGSRFTISLPHPRDAGGAAAQPPQPSPCTSASLKILIVDDNHDAAQMLAMYLEALGHTVSVEHSAHAALARAAAERPQVCLLDIGLPEMDGNQLARRLSQQPQTQDAVLVAISGYGQEHDRAAARDAGFRQYFVKPVDVDQLSAFLAQVALRQTG